ncbi:hypothetical protein LSH36_364g00051 [Paralvinella palmiformis]|uniref:Uncharacterized protein n=1 Tax=Paralvinella palmiformis TaxID=53620 RepID=A0AAD9JE09_9ANNE|nr:hypothetical protein LSH36_364g00051 [Paralvinella palmiformis]
MITMECHHIQENLIFTCIEEKDQENEDDIRQALPNLFREMELDATNISIISCHRMPSFGKKKTHQRCNCSF